jgi:hypothetical protein
MQQSFREELKITTRIGHKQTKGVCNKTDNHKSKLEKMLHYCHVLARMVDDDDDAYFNERIRFLPRHAAHRTKEVLTV